MRTTVHIATFLATALALACSGGSDKDKGESKADTPAEPAPADEGADAPAWVNSSYLTCTWDRAVDEKQAGVTCDAGSKDAPQVTVTTWVVTEGEKVATNVRATPNGNKVDLVQPAKDFAVQTITASLSDGTHTKPVKVELKKVLEGLDGPKLLACFNSEIAVADCFNAIGIKLPTSDDLVAKPTITSPTTCATKDSLPEGVLCELYSDAMVGDFDQGRNWFQTGSDLLTPDGKIAAETFCDASGIKERFTRSAIDRNTRYFPYLAAKDDGACFEFFIPNASPNHPFFKQQVVTNEQGDWLCAFFLLEEDLFVGLATQTRMHIVKNPAKFPDAANPGLTLDALKKTADHFHCRF